LGSAKRQSGLRPLWRFAPPHFLCAGIASQFLYRAQKPSHTAKTLNAICPGLGIRLIYKIDIIKKFFLPHIIVRKRHPWRMKFTPKSAKRIKKQNNGIKISRIIGKWAIAHNKYKKCTPKFLKNGIITPFLILLFF
jgi:hypothetical protein